MSGTIKDDISNILAKVDRNKYSHVIVCINRLNGTFFFKCVETNENVEEEVSKIREQGIYAMIIVEEIGNTKFEERNIASEALDYATMMHDGQYRKDGTDYINHPIRVANYVSEFKSSLNMDVLLASAYLHDTLEDTKATYYDIVNKFGPQIAGLVLELTTDEEIKKYLGKTKYLEIKMKNMSSWALLIKLCDRLDNVSDLMTSSENFRNRYARETIDILNYLLSNRELSDTHINIIKSILTRLNKCDIVGDDVANTIQTVDAKVKALV